MTKRKYTITVKSENAIMLIDQLMAEREKLLDERRRLDRLIADKHTENERLRTALEAIAAVAAVDGKTAVEMALHALKVAITQ